MKTINLRKYQQEIFAGVGTQLKRGKKRVMVQSPCRSGKTEVMLSLIQTMLKKNLGDIFILSHKVLIKDEINTRLEKYSMNSPFIFNETIFSVDKITSEKPFAIFIDEAHHSRAKSYENLLEKYPEAYVFGFTATPERADGKGFSAIFEEIVVGPSVSDLIEWDYLPNYKAFKFNTASKTADIMGNAAEWYLKYGNGEQALYYAHRDIEDLPIIKKHFEDAGIAAQYLVGGEKEKQIEILDNFKKKKFKVLISIDTLGEGIDVPECSIVMMGRKTTSSTVYVQQTMRCMSRDKNNPNKIAKIVDLVGNFDIHGTIEQDRNWVLLDDKESLTVPGNKKRRELVRNKVTFNFKTEIEEIDPADYNITKDTELMTYHEIIARFKANNYLPGWVYHQMKHKAWQDRNPEALPYRTIVRFLYEDYNRRNRTQLKPGQTDTNRQTRRTVYNY